MGELSLDGTLLPVNGVLPIALRAREEGFKGVIVPLKNAREAAVVEGLNVYGMEKLGDVVEFFNGSRKFTPVKVDLLEIFASVQTSMMLIFQMSADRRMSNGLSK
jgi:magnesium chelatase family protein